MNSLRLKSNSSIICSMLGSLSSLKGKKLFLLSLGFFLVFIVIGILIGQFSNLIPDNKNGSEAVPEVKVTETPLVEKVGKVVYVDPSLYPNDNISYKLINEKGDDIILLSASDDKLKVVEGATVKLKGRLEKTKDGSRDVFFVEQIVFD